MRAAPLALLLVIPGLSAAQATPQDVAKIVAEGKDRNQVMRTLKQLTDIGPRLTSSPNLAKAQRWAMGKFRSYGLSDVRLEKWGDVPVGFERGARQIGRMTAPFESDFEFTTMNWAPGTDGMKKGRAVLCPSTLAEAEAKREELRGAWVVMPTKATMRGPANAPADDVKRALDGAGILGRIYGAADERVHSSGNWRDKTFDKRPTDLNIVVRKSDYDRIKRNVEYGRDTRLEFDIETKWFRGPIPQYNVIADLKGSERPDEIVIVCGHLDSWNSPGSQGACDNGTGSSVALEAARILTAAKVRPKRTIRFVLWSGEEQGLLGSRGYVQTHKDELGKISAVLNDDGGTGYQGGYQGVVAMKTAMEAAFAPTNAAFPEMVQTFDVLEKMPAGGSSDHAPFNWEGVPGFFTKEMGKKADYGRVWHTQYDRYDAAVPEYLIQASTNHAVVAFSLAQAPELLARAPKPDRAGALNVRGALAVGSDRFSYPWLFVEDEDGDHSGHDHADDWTLEMVDRLKRFVSGYLGRR